MMFLPLIYAVVQIVCANPQTQPYRHALTARQASPSSSDPLRVDLGYEIYQGTANSSTDINSWRGIRFAKAPTGALRWQRPQAPDVNRGNVTQADHYGPICYQVGISGPPATPPSSTGPTPSEDCLFLNVDSPANATKLPVLVWIHGGGYGLGNGRLDFTDLLRTNNNSFVAVSIQYRLGPFGFLASDEVFRKGAANAGLLDQFFALQWVQTYISQFGGDPDAVTITGESAGGGSVMLQDMAYGGSLGDSMFRSTIAASPYLPKQYKYNGWVPTQAYYAFADRAGCPLSAYGRASQTVFSCLLSKDAETLQNASLLVTTTGLYGTWVFLPVTDGVFVQEEPSQQLLKKKVNGRNMLAGNNANEGPAFVPNNITTEDALTAWLHDLLPDFTDGDINKVLLYYPGSNLTTNSSDSRFATEGASGPSALNQSSVATGQQQRANNIYAELTFVCPSYWMAEAYTGQDKVAYKYQFSPLPATHGMDVAGYIGPLGSVPDLSQDFQRAFMTIWGNFVTKEDPRISAAVAAGSASNQTNGGTESIDWPMFSNAAPYQLNLNQTGGTESLGPSGAFFTGPGLRNNFTLGDAFTWEAGRGTRCDFWRSSASIIPA